MPPEGLSPATRMIKAFQDLEDAFAVAGMSKPPVAVLVAPGDRARMEWLIRQHPSLLVTDNSSKDTSIWGIKVREE